MNNLEALRALKQSAAEQNKELERSIKEIHEQSLKQMSEDFLNTMTERMDKIEASVGLYINQGYGSQNINSNNNYSNNYQELSSEEQTLIGYFRKFDEMTKIQILMYVLEKHIGEQELTYSHR